MEVADVGSRRRGDSHCHGFGDSPFLMKAYVVGKTTKPRRFSASNLTSFRKDTMSFRNVANICSTASSPGYFSGDQIDPSTYSFTTALKALQARSINEREYLSFKWNEAEKYISNPYSGEVPMECLSSKVLSGRAHPAVSERLTRSGPLFFSNAHLVQTRASMKYEVTQPRIEAVDKLRARKQRLPTKDVGIQSNLRGGFDFSSSNSSLGTTAAAKESSFTSCNSGGSNSSSYDEEPATRIEEGAGKYKEEMETYNERREGKEMGKCRSWGCLAWGLWPRMHKRKDLK